MSRLIVKNLPNGITEQRLRTVFGQKGTVTDINLKFAKNGVFRKFAFIGFQTAEEAQTAREYFNSTFIDTAKIQVEECRSLGDSEKPRAWSQHSHESSRFQAQHIGSTPKTDKKPGPLITENIKKRPEEEDKFAQILRNPLLSENEKTLIEKSRNDPDFIEFFQIKNNKSAWNNDDLRSFPEGGGASAKVELSKEVLKEDEKKDDFNKMKNSVKLKRLPKGASKSLIREFFQPLNPSRVFLPKKAKDIAFVQFATKEEVQKALVYDKKQITGQTVSVSKCHDESTESTEPGEFGESVESSAAPEVSRDPALQAEPLGDSGRLFVRNLPFTCTADDLETLFAKFGPIAEVKLPIDYMTQRCKGYGIVTFMMPEHAVKALSLDGKDFRGRVVHVIPAQPKREEEVPPPPVGSNTSAFKKEKKAKLKNSSQNVKNWNSLFLGTNAVMDVMAERYKVSKGQILSSEGSGQSAGVRVALGETQIVTETKNFLLSNGVKLDVFTQMNAARSKTVILVKNLPAGTPAEALMKLFSEHGTVSRVVLPPAGITALVEMVNSVDAKKAFRGLAYFKFGSLPLFLEWAPEDVLEKPSSLPVPAPAPAPAPKSEGSQKTQAENVAKKLDETANVFSETQKTTFSQKEKTSLSEGAEGAEGAEGEEGGEEEEPTESLPGSTIFVKNLNFLTVEDSLYDFFSSAGPIKSATVARKLGPKGETLSMGYGFVQFKNLNAAKEAIRTLQNAVLDGHTLELKVSERTVRPVFENTKKTVKSQEQTSAKIMVRNIPFQASEKEIRDIFGVFGELKSVRLPKKMGETGTHRGFCFIEYHSQKDAKRAFDALSLSTHLYSRRLVLEWAEADDQNVDLLRHKVAEHFHEDNSSRKKLKKRHLYDELDQTVQTEMDQE